MPPLANEAEHAHYWASQPHPTTREGWIDEYANLLGRARPAMTLHEAYSHAAAAYEREASIHPRLSLATALIFGDYPRASSASS